MSQDRADLPDLPAVVYDELLEILFGGGSDREARLLELIDRSGVDEDAIRAHVAFHDSLSPDFGEHDPETMEFSLTAPISPRRGDRFGRYRIIECIKVGGMGAVYLAQDEELARRVALKIIRPDRLTDPGSHERFRREARMVANLSHPGICPLYEVGITDGVPFLAMQFIAGTTLSGELAKRRTASVPEAALPTNHRDLSAVLLTMELVAEALHAAHEAGVVHRDVKPGNILIDEHGKPVLIDFGLAYEQVRPLGEQTLTGAGDILGTPPYMSPEQVRPRGRIDRRTDVYSLGVTLFECLTLHHPFAAADQLSLFERIERDETPDPRRINPRLPADLSAVLAKAMEKDPGHRYATALSFADELRRVRTLQPVHARRIGRLGRLMRWSRRNRIATAFFAAMVLLLSVIGTLLVQSTWQRAALAAQTRESAARALLGAAARQATLDPNLSLALACRVYEELPGPESLDQVRQSMAACAELAVLRGHTHYVLSSAVAADGSLAVTGSYDGTVRVWDRSGRELRRFDLGGQVTALEFLQDTRQVLVTTAHAGGSDPADPPHGRSLRLDLDSGEETRIEEGAAPRFAIARVSGGRIAVATEDGQLRIVGDGGRDFPHGSSVWKLAVSPRNGNLLATSDYAKKVRVFDLAASGAEPRFALELPGYVDALAFSPTRDELLIGDFAGNLRIVSLDGGVLLSARHGNAGGSRVRQLAWSRDGRSFLSVGNDGRGWLRSREGELLAQLIGHLGEVYCCAELTDGTGWATAGEDATVRLWNSRGIEQRLLRGHDSAISGGLSFSADGRTLLSASADCSARLWDLSAEHRGILNSPAGGFMTVQFVPGTRRIAATTADGHVVQWDEARRPIDLALPGRTYTPSADFTADGKLLVAQFGGAIHLVDLVRHTIERSWHPKDEGDTAGRIVDALPDGRVLVLQQMWYGFPSAVRRTTPALGEPELVAQLPPGLIVHDFAADRGGTRIWLACGDGAIRLVRDGGRVEEVVPPTGHGHTGIAVSPDGRWLATGGSDAAVGLFEIGSDPAKPLREVRTLRGHLGDILRVRFAPDSRRLVSTSRDRTARVWRVDGELVATLTGHDGFVYDACWSPDGRGILTASFDGTIRSWFSDASELLAHARARIVPPSPADLEPYRELLRALDSR